MLLTKDLKWNSIALPLSELNLSKVLICGQAFRWRAHPQHQQPETPTIWSSTLDSHVIFLKQTSNELNYCSYPTHPKIHSLIHDYFNLHVNLEDLYEQWAKVDQNFKSKSGRFEGVRMLKQDPFETLISFICSSNNNIKRISQMCENLCLNYGDLIAEIDGVNYHSFPTVDKLQELNLEARLREIGFGYRANYIASTCSHIHTESHDISALRSVPYQEAHNSLLQYKGIGPKIADCICLMALDKHNTIPVDTHVFQIAKRDYKMKLKGDAVNKGNYTVIADFFKVQWGEFAGWAQSVVFAADLKDLNKGATDTVVKVKKESNKVSVKRELEVDVKLHVKEELQKEQVILETVIDEIEYHNNGRPKRRKVVKKEN